MKALIFIYLFLAAFIMSHDSLAATDKKEVSFRYTAVDMDIKTKGKNIHQAREVASEKCFDQRMKEFRKARHSEPSEDQALMIIDSCVNI